MLNKQVCLVICALFLTGCSSAPQVVSVPIAVKASVAPVVERPHIYLMDVPPEAISACDTSSERCGEVMKAWEATVESLTGWGMELEGVLRTYQ